MGKVYKDKKGRGCAYCKPHKHGWTPKKKDKVRADEEAADRQVAEVLAGIKQGRRNKR